MTSGDGLFVSFGCCLSAELVMTFFFWEFWTVLFDVILVPLFDGLRVGG